MDVLDHVKGSEADLPSNGGSSCLWHVKLDCMRYPCKEPWWLLLVSFLYSISKGINVTVLQHSLPCKCSTIFWGIVLSSALAFNLKQLYKPATATVLYQALGFPGCFICHCTVIAHINTTFISLERWKGMYCALQILSKWLLTHSL